MAASKQTASDWTEAEDELRDLAGWLAGIMHDHGGRSAMVRAICDGGRMVVAGNLYVQGRGMGTPPAALEFREELDDGKIG